MTEQEAWQREAQRAACKLWAKLRERFFDDEASELDADMFQQIGAELGLLRQVEYDPEQHPGVDAEDGDLIWQETDLARAVCNIARQP